MQITLWLRSQWRPLALGLAGLVLGIYEVTLPLGLGMRLPLSVLAGLLGASLTERPLVGALAGALAGGAGGLPASVAQAYASGVATWGFARSRRPLGQRAVVLLSQAVLIGLLPLAQVAARGDWAMLGATAPVVAIALLPATVLLALLMPWLLRPVGWKLLTPLLLAGGIGFTLWNLAPTPTASLAPVNGLHAGAARADITPAPLETYLGGYSGRPDPAKGAYAPLTIRVLMLQQGADRVTFIALDAVGIGNRLMARLQAAAGGESAFISATHSHAGPDLQGIWGGATSAYEDRLVEQTGAAVAAAAAALRPAEVRTVSTAVAGLQKNRRGWESTPERLSVLQAKGTDGGVIGTLVNFGVHPTVLPRENLLAGPDFVGALTESLDQQLGGVTLYINGAQGDVTPNAPGSPDPFVRAADFGRRLGDEVVGALGQARAVPANAGLTVRHTGFRTPLGNWGFQALTSLGRLRYEMPLRGPVTQVKTRASLIRLGDGVTFLTAPGEVTTRLAARADQLLPAGDTFFLGLTHDSLGYMIPRDEWHTDRNRNYEESVSVGPAMGEDYLQAVARLTSHQ